MCSLGFEFRTLLHWVIFGLEALGRELPVANKGTDLHHGLSGKLLAALWDNIQINCAMQVSVMHSVQGGYLDKALSYAEKCMHFISLGSNSKGSAYNVSCVVVMTLVQVTVWWVWCLFCMPICWSR